MASPTASLIPISLALSPAQIDWLDSRRQAGHLSRSAAIRLLLDDAIRANARLRNPAHGR